MARVFSELLIHARPRLQLEQFLSQPSHALMISGPPGSGKRNAAEHLASRLLGLDSVDKLAEHPYFISITRDEGKQDISLDAIKMITRSLRLKTTGKSTLRRVVLVENAELMSHEAQNALLKILEEPPADSLIILTAASPRSVLPTIASRAQQIQLQSVELKAALAFFTDLHTPARIESAWLLSGGRTGLTAALLEAEQLHPLKKAVADAKQLLGESQTKKIQVLDQLGRSKADLYDLLGGLSLVMSALHHRSLDQGRARQAEKLLANRRLVKDSLTKLEANTQARLVALHLALNLKA